MDGVFDSLTVTTPRGTLSFVDGVFRIEAPGGVLEFGFDAGNELRIRSLGADPAKIRFEGQPGVMHGLSWSDVVDGVAQEHTLVTGRADEQQPASLGGQFVLSIRSRHNGGDESMRKMLVASAAYTEDGKPAVWVHPNLGPFTEAPLPGPPTESLPTAITSLVNLTGSLSAVQGFNDGQWLTAIDQSQDTGCELALPLNGQAVLEVEVRPAGSGTPPYVYVKVNGVTVINGAQPSGHMVLAGSIPAGVAQGLATVRIHGSAQGGTPEIGGVRAR